jgi:hypothetical protein
MHLGPGAVPGKIIRHRGRKILRERLRAMTVRMFV